MDIKKPTQAKEHCSNVIEYRIKLARELREEELRLERIGHINKCPWSVLKQLSLQFN